MILKTCSLCEMTFIEHERPQHGLNIETMYLTLIVALGGKLSQNSKCYAKIDPLKR